MNRIKELRKQKKWNQSVLAQKLNTTQANISGWEKSKWQPDNDALIKLSEIFNVSVDYLLGNTNEIIATQNSIIVTPEQAKDIWFATLDKDDQETINLYLMLNYTDKLRVNGYILSKLNQANI